MKEKRIPLLAAFAVAFVLCAALSFTQNVYADQGGFDPDAPWPTSYEQAEQTAQTYVTKWYALYKGAYDLNDIVPAEDDFYIPVEGTVANYPYLDGISADAKFRMAIGGNSYLEGYYYRNTSEGLAIAFPIMLFEGTENPNALNITNVTSAGSDYVKVTGSQPKFTLQHDNGYGTASVGIGISGVEKGDVLITKKELTKNGKTTMTYEFMPADAANATGGVSAGIKSYMFGWAGSRQKVGTTLNGATIKYTVFAVGKGKTSPLTLNLKVGHFWDKGTIDPKATCTSAGKKTYCCLGCGAEKTETIAKLGHNMTKVNGYPAKPGHIGKRTHWHCSRCKKDFLNAAGTKKGNLTIYDPDAITFDARLFYYTGKAIKPKFVVYDSNDKIISASNYTVKYTNNVKAGDETARAIYTFKGELYSGTMTKVFSIEPAKNKLSIEAKTATVKRKAVKKKTQVLGVTKVITFKNKGQGAKTYVKASGNKKIIIAKKTGKVTVKKGLKKGTYKVKVKVKAKGTKNYKASPWRSVTFTIIVK